MCLNSHGNANLDNSVIHFCNEKLGLVGGAGLTRHLMTPKYKHNKADTKSSYPSDLHIFQTNLGPTSADLIFYAPKVANLRFWKI